VPWATIAAMIRTVARRKPRSRRVTTSALAFPRHSAEVAGEQTPHPISDRDTFRRGRWKGVGIAVVALALVIGGFLRLSSMRLPRHDLGYTQLTDFTDSAVAPALSPDGRMLAFIRGAQWFGRRIRFTSRCS
jgi:hypothetical protein